MRLKQKNEERKAVTKRLAIVSTYGDYCGIAAYAEVLHKEFAKYYEVEIVKLNVGLLNHPSYAVGDAYVKELAQQLKSFDYVNIQFESGVFGPPQKIMQRFKLLGDASKNLIVTMHHYDKKLSLFNKALAFYLFKFQIKKAVHHICSVMRLNTYAQLYEDMIIYCRDNGKAIVVHTKREQDLIKKIYHIEKIYDHPLIFLSKDAVTTSREQVSREAFNKRYLLNKEDVAIGIFGFLGPYKGYLTAIKAMQYLPDNYKLLIFGRQHPLSIQQQEEINPYLQTILSEIETCSLKKENLTERILFCGGLSNEDFVLALLSCDLAILPYLEVTQSGSGIASLILDAGVPAIFSQNLTFLELEKYAPDAFKMFSIGNYLELAQAIRCYDPADYAEGLERYQENYNMDTNVAMYRKIFET